MVPNGVHTACEALEGPFDEDCIKCPSSGASGTECRRATSFLLILVLEVLNVLMPIYLNWIVDLKELLSETQRNCTH